MDIMFDTIIKNGRIIDGTGCPWRRSDIGIKEGKIAKIGRINPDQYPDADVIDAKDNYVTPGFIDIHNHSDKTLGSCQLAESRIFQGVTTEIGGNCGMSPFPIAEEYLEDLKNYMASDLPFTWDSMDGFFEYLAQKGISTNFGCLTGHGSVRLAVLGMSPDKADSEQLEQMYQLTKECLKNGSFGVSSGLIYPPGSYSDADEMIAVLKAVKEEGGFYATHMRNEGKRLIPSTKEAIAVAKAADVPLEISHHKCIDKAQWGQAVYETTAMIEEARREGLEVTCDQYPYNASSTVLSSNIPGWAFEGGFEKMVERLHDKEIRAKLKAQSDEDHLNRWQDILVSSVASEKNAWMVGQDVVSLGEQLGKSAADLVFDLVEEENNCVYEINFGMDEGDIEHIMKRPYVMPGSDGEARSLNEEGRPHPRSYGSFTRVLAHYCRDRQLFSLEEAIRKMTSLPAGKIGLQDRGLIKEGMWADIVVFDFEKLKSNPDYDNPQQKSDGIEYVFVNGVLTAKQGEHLGVKAGMILRANR